MSKNGLVSTAIFATGHIVYDKLPPIAEIKKFIITLIAESMSVQNRGDMPNLKRRTLFIVDGEKFYIDECQGTIQYLFGKLSHSDIPFTERDLTAQRHLEDHINFQDNDPNGLILCLVMIIRLLKEGNSSSYFILLDNMLALLKKGKLPRAIVIKIVTKLLQYGLPIDQELLDLLGL